VNVKGLPRVKEGRTIGGSDVGLISYNHDGIIIGYEFAGNFETVSGLVYFTRLAVRIFEISELPMLLNFEIFRHEF
jgi:hypothetical protein